MAKLVKWLGTPGRKSHDVNCRRIVHEENAGKVFPVVPASSVPANVGRCQWCGGGR